MKFSSNMISSIRLYKIAQNFSNLKMITILYLKAELGASPRLLRSG